MFVHVVGTASDPHTRDLAAAVAVRLGSEVAVHDSIAEFLLEYDRGRTACLVLDLAHDADPGLDLLAGLDARGERLPTLVLADEADVETIVRAIRLGAADFHEKPADELRLVARLTSMLGEARAARDLRLDRQRWGLAVDRMTPREREVFQALGRGMSAKQIAESLGTSIRTAHIHRANVLRKLDVDSAVRVVEISRRLFPPAS